VTRASRRNSPVPSPESRVPILESRLSRAFARARSENRAALIAYLTAGDPDAAQTEALAVELDAAGADILELGVAFSDPIADGPALQRAAERALAAGVGLDEIFQLARRIRDRTSLALVLFSYLNPLLARGIGRTAREARQSGFDGVLVTDLPPEEARGFQQAFRAAGLDTIFLVSPTSPAPRMRQAARLSSGFLYVVSRSGVTGAREGLPADLPRTVARARAAASGLPVAVGFGIASPESAAAAARLADGVVVGSALVSAAHAAGDDRVRAAGELTRRLASSLARGAE
jgi:tryptophan synthase alpha chain